MCIRDRQGTLSAMTCDFLPLAAPGVRTLQPYQPGKPESELRREYGLTDIVKLASNENPLGPCLLYTSRCV